MLPCLDRQYRCLILPRIQISIENNCKNGFFLYDTARMLLSVKQTSLGSPARSKCMSSGGMVTSLKSRAVISKNRTYWLFTSTTTVFVFGQIVSDTFNRLLATLRPLSSSSASSSRGSNSDTSIPGSSTLEASNLPVIISQSISMLSIEVDTTSSGVTVLHATLVRLATWPKQ
ncbi:hypothetical protein PsorP6_006881 [Peronosclerospora sorghi]|uniref:Uncharacterized protein n=1 Tax=Peronosclerospora sorghi TaxID=230839 RepID=A0ACC0W875_9STRA|nr:hypothetical protein PsorP6_006881 [Peronosclerospora sorghi]